MHVQVGAHRVRSVGEVDTDGIRQHQPQHDVLQRASLQLGPIEPRLVVVVVVVVVLITLSSCWRYYDDDYNYYYYDDDCSSRQLLLLLLLLPTYPTHLAAELVA